MLLNIIKNREITNLLVYLYLLISSFILADIFTYFVSKLAVKFNILDHPGERKVHIVPKPLCGGFAIYFSLFFVIGINISIFFLLLKSNLINNDIFWIKTNLIYFKRAIPLLAGLIIGTSIITLIGFIDDVRGMDPKIKFFFQFLVAGISVYSGIKITLFHIPLLNELITVLWIVGLTNSINLLDNMDGLSGGVSAIISFSIFVVSISLKQYFVAMICITLMGSILGFLKHNISPAKIFMGDTGALMIGYLLSNITIIATFYTKDVPNYFAVLTPLFLMTTPIFDTFSVMFIRMKNKKPLFVGDKNHLSHRINSLGFTKRRSVIVIYILTIISCFSSILLTAVNKFGAYLILIQILFLIVLTIILMNAKKVENKNIQSAA